MWLRRELNYFLTIMQYDIIIQFHFKYPVSVQNILKLNLSKLELEGMGFNESFYNICEIYMYIYKR